MKYSCNSSCTCVFWTLGLCCMSACSNSLAYFAYPIRAQTLKLIFIHTDVWKVVGEDRKHTPTHTHRDSVWLSEHSCRPAPGQPESTCLPDSSLVARLVVKALLWHHQRQTAARGHSCLQQSQPPLQTINQSHILQKKEASPVSLVWTTEWTFSTSVKRKITKKCHGWNDQRWKPELVKRRLPV